MFGSHHLSEVQRKTCRSWFLPHEFLELRPTGLALNFLCFGCFEAGSHGIALAGLELDCVGQANLKLTELPQPESKFSF